MFIVDGEFDLGSLVYKYESSGFGRSLVLRIAATLLDRDSVVSSLISTFDQRCKITPEKSTVAPPWLNEDSIWPLHLPLRLGIFTRPIRFNGPNLQRYRSNHQHNVA